MKDGQIISEAMVMTRGAITMLNYFFNRRGGYIDIPTATLNARLGLNNPRDILYFERVRKPASEKRPKGDGKFSQGRIITLFPDYSFDLFTFLSRQGGKSNGT